MPHGWTPERRRRQAELIRTWRPWEASTGPKGAAGKARVARNAWRGGRRQQFRAWGRVLRVELEQMREFTDSILR